MIEFTILGQVKSDKNHMQITRSGRHYPLPAFAKWRDDVIRQIDHINVLTFDKPCSIQFSYWKGNLIKRDVPGMIDAIFHVLEKAKFITDDSLFVNVHWLDMGLDKKNPRLKIIMNYERN